VVGSIVIALKSLPHADIADILEMTLEIYGPSLHIYIWFSSCRNQQRTNSDPSQSFADFITIINDVRMGGTASMPLLITQYLAVAVWSWWRLDWWRIFAVYCDTQWMVISMTFLCNRRGTSDLPFVCMFVWLNTCNWAPKLAPIHVPSAGSQWFFHVLSALMARSTKHQGQLSYRNLLSPWCEVVVDWREYFILLNLFAIAHPRSGVQMKPIRFDRRCERFILRSLIALQARSQCTYTFLICLRPPLTSVTPQGTYINSETKLVVECSTIPLECDFPQIMPVEKKQAKLPVFSTRRHFNSFLWGMLYQRYFDAPWRGVHPNLHFTRAEPVVSVSIGHTTIGFYLLLASVMGNMNVGMLPQTGTLFSAAFQQNSSPRSSPLMFDRIISCAGNHVSYYAASFPSRCVSSKSRTYSSQLLHVFFWAFQEE